MQGMHHYENREMENACKFIDKADKRMVIEMTDLKFKQQEDHS